MKITRLIFHPGGTYEKRSVKVLPNYLVDVQRRQTIVMDADNPPSVDTVPIVFKTWEDLLKGMGDPRLVQKPYPFLAGLTGRIPAFFSSSAGVPFPQQHTKGYREYHPLLAKWRSVTGEAIAKANTEIGQAETGKDNSRITTVLLVVILAASLTFTLLVGRIALS